MKKILVPYALIPAAILILVTVLRAWLELNSPDIAKFASANVLSMVWMLGAPALMLKKGLSLVQGLLAGLVFFVLHRAVIGGVYAMAWANQWTVAGTETPVRYVVQTRDQSPDASATVVFLQTAFFPVAFGLVFLLVIWAITWAIAFRGKRGFASAAT